MMNGLNTAQSFTINPKRAHNENPQPQTITSARQNPVIHPGIALHHRHNCLLRRLGGFVGLEGMIHLLTL